MSHECGVVRTSWARRFLFLLWLTSTHPFRGCDLSAQPAASAPLTNWAEGFFGTNAIVSSKNYFLQFKEGKVSLQEADAAKVTEIEGGRSLATGDKLETAEYSRALILNVQRGAALDASGTIRILPQRRLELMAGNLYFKSLGPDSKEEMWVRTPVGQARVIGTEFHLSVAPETGRTVLSLLDGEVFLTNEVGAVTVRSEQQAVIEAADRPMTQPAPITTFNTIIQWILYYPAVLDLEDLPERIEEVSELKSSVDAYKLGNIRKAFELYPPKREPASESERIYRAALLLSAGRIKEVEAELNSLAAPQNSIVSGTNNLVRLAQALRLLNAAVKFEKVEPGAVPRLATEWMAESYYLQSHSKLKEARQAAREAAKSAKFGYGQARLAELEFSFGEIRKSKAALSRALELSPENAQAVALEGFLYSAEYRTKEAFHSFEKAVALDGRLGNAWLGLGLSFIHRGDFTNGLVCLQTAVAQEPQRAVLRGYLGKAYHTAGEIGWGNQQLIDRARQELEIAKRMDPNDPTPWLYSALLKQQANEINEAVQDLQKSKELNNNRSVYRSRLLLDQDQAVRSANLAGIYRDAWMPDVSVREASRAVNYDYGNYSAHLFLANSYDALRDPRGVTLRYETPWANELFLANLLAPVGAGSLSQSISQQEYSRLFERERSLGIFSRTDYASNGDWLQTGSQYGTLGGTSYSVDAYYFNQQGFRPNETQETLALWGTVKQRLTPDDSLLLQVIYSDKDAGDLAQYYDQSSALADLKIHETQEPIVLGGYHHQWSPESHTLFLFARLDDSIQVLNPSDSALEVERNRRTQEIARIRALATDLNYQSKLEIYSAELQQIYSGDRWGTILGARYQAGTFDTEEALRFPISPNSTNQAVTTDFERLSLYGYESLKLHDALQLTAGLSYDWVNYPINHSFSPISTEERSKDKFSPKAGILWTPFRDTSVRAAYTRSLGGVSFDQSFRLEPVQVAGFLQSFRSLVPESVAGSLPVPSFETWGLALDQRLGKKTYFGITAERLDSHAKKTEGAFDRVGFDPLTLSTLQSEVSFRENSLLFNFNQLMGQAWSFGIHYRLSHSEFDQDFQTYRADSLVFDLGSLQTTNSPQNRNLSATLHELNLNLLYQHPKGFFSIVEGIWRAQRNCGDYTSLGYPSPNLPGDDFWQLNVYAGYRFLQRRLELRLGLLNITDQDYQLNPISVYSELPRERTFAATLKFQF